MTTLYGRGRRAALALLALLPLAVMQAHAEDGYDLWLRYHPIADDALRAHYQKAASEIVDVPHAAGAEASAGQAPTLTNAAPTTLAVAEAELVRGLSGL